MMDGTRNEGLSRVEEKNFRLDNRENFLMLKIVKHWNSWLWEIASSLEVIKNRQDKYVRNDIM